MTNSNSDSLAQRNMFSAHDNDRSHSTPGRLVRCPVMEDLRRASSPRELIRLQALFPAEDFIVLGSSITTQGAVDRPIRSGPTMGSPETSLSGTGKRSFPSAELI